MRKIICCLMILLMLVWLTVSAPAEGWDFMCNHMKIEAYIHGQWVELTQAMYYSHEGYRIADGFLMFMPLSEYIASFEIQEAYLTDMFSYRVSYDGYIDSFSCDRMILQESEDGLAAVKKAENGFGDLPSGRYLLEFSFTASRTTAAMNEVYRGACFLWLIVP